MKKITMKDDKHVSVYVIGNSVVKRYKSRSPVFVEYLEREYENYVKVQNSKGKIRFPKAINFSRKKCELVTEFIAGVNLKDSIRKEIFYDFGKALKALHEKGISHGHLEIQDVLLYGGCFYLVDLPKVNSCHPLKDYARLKISIYLKQIRDPWKWASYRDCAEAFTEGYLPDGELSGKFLDRELNSIIQRYKEGGWKDKVKAMIIKVLIGQREKL